jgi:hypothetical protein
MKRILLILFILSGFFAKAQNFNNEWIDYSKTYYKFKVGATGLYRISQATLSTLGLSAVQAEHFQLWRNGEEVPLYTSVQTGTLGTSDYIEFWGKRNDGKPDKVLYRNPDFQLSDAYSLNTDTAAFFLTVNTASPNLRLVPTINDVAGNSLPVEPYFMHTAGVNFRIKENAGFAAVISEYVYSSSYDQGEGWTTGDIGKTTTTEFTLGTFPNLFVYTGIDGPQPRFRINAAGNAINPRVFQYKINGTVIDSTVMDYFDYAKVDVPVDTSLLTSPTTTITLRNNSPVSSDRMVVSMFAIDYPRKFYFDNSINFAFRLPASASGNYLEINDFNYQGVTPVLYDLTNGQRYVADMGIQPTLRFKLLPSSAERELVLVSENSSNILNITGAIQRNFTNFSNTSQQGDYLIITHPVFTNGANSTNPIEAYRAYRSSAAGGSYNAKVYMIDDLIDQFAFGIKMHPLAVRNFMRWARANFSTEPKHVFLIGKGLNYSQFRAFESNPDVGRLSFVPTFGHPASDNLLTAEPGNLIPKTPVGRLSVITPDEVKVYLDKVIEYEQVQASSSPYIADKAWMKNVVHVVGASDGNLDALLESYMINYKAIIADTLFGANVHLFSKRSAESVTLLNSARIAKLMEEGISLLTYFGHSSSSTLEFNLDDPQRYNNTGKYPVMIVMGCNAGNLFNFNTIRFLTKETLSEKFVLAQQRGAIAFIASTHFGIVHYLDIYNSRDYNAITNTYYGRTLGEQMKETITQVFNLTTQLDYYARFQCEQTSLHGDPAIKINAFAKPDYVIEEPLVTLSPTFISIAETQFNLKAKMLNIGKAVNKDIVVEVKRTYPNPGMPAEVIYRDTIPGIRFADSIDINIPVIAIRDKGLNKITVTVDAGNSVDELYETNNTVTKDFFIYEDEARPVYPYNFAIINKQNIKLVASTANPLSPLKQYNMELDTTELFNSPVKISKSITSTGGVLEFAPGVTFTDSTVYYWRVAPQPTTGSPAWNTSSFIYLANHDVGFNQSHFFQHLKSTNENILVKNDRRWVFDSVNQNIFIRNAIYPTAATQAADFTISVNDSDYIGAGCFYDALIINVFNPNTMLAMKNDYSNGTTGLYESLRSVCGTKREYNFEYYYSDTASRRKMMNFLNNVVPNGWYVTIRANVSPTVPATPMYADAWRNDTLLYGSGISLYHLLYNQGFTTIDSFNRPRTFILAYKKNGQASFPTQFAFTQSNYDKVTLDVDIKTSDTTGLVTSPAFGPAKQWKTLSWRGTTLPDAVPKDRISVALIGVDYAGAETVLIPALSASQQDYDISTIDPVAYPYLKVQMLTIDTLDLTPYQLRYWRLTYVPVPEGAIAPNILFVSKDTLDIGEPFDFKVAFKNVSEASFDSLRIKMIITDKNNTTDSIVIPRSRPLPSQDTIQITARIPTSALTGHNTIYVEANPYNDQPEQYHFNNFLFKSLYVRPDSLNPLLDVTFDNVHILNRDIVASKPHIIAKLKDEAKWMILDDTTLLTVNIKFPNGSIHRYYFSNDTLRFTPAGQAPNPNNTATIDFLPYFTQDGEYELIITGKDKSDNAAGNIEYRVVFKVINKPMISNMLNYPNPFTTSTAFVFTITGSEVPQNIRIQILTITGKVVREITKDELGPLHIGRNITEFKWDGTDMYGSKLANGIYLYRVITNHKGKSLEKYRSDDPDNEDNTDKYFNNGYGKMYLMR